MRQQHHKLVSILTSYFNDVLATFLGLECGRSVAVYAESESFWISSKYLNLCSEDA